MTQPERKLETKITNAEISSEEGKRSLQKIQDALLEAEYSEMDNGDRKYLNQSLDTYMLPLLENLKLQVCITTYRQRVKLK